MPVLGPSSGTPLAGDILTLAEAKLYLNITATSHDAELPGFITAVTPLIEHHIGSAVVPRTVTEELRVDSRGGVLFLSNVFVTSITSVTEYSSGTGTVLTAEDYDTEGTYVLRDGGMLRRRSGWADYTWTIGTVIRVVYVAGFDPIPEPIKRAAGEVLRHIWHKTQTGNRGLFGGPDPDDPVTFAGTFEGLPHLARTLLAPYARGPMVA